MIEIKPYFSKLLSERAAYLQPVQHDVEITDDTGKVYFRQQGVTAPAGWSYLAVQVVVSKYFRGQVGTAERESSIFDVVRRVVRVLARWAVPYIGEEQRLLYEEELYALVILQYMSFNSPVWFNVGVEDHPQCSACFINSVEDTLESILELAKTEGMLFKYGSGTGSNLSTLRSSKEGYASGPVSFMKGFDSFAGVIKSGGKTRRAAKMVILNDDHPDVLEFIQCKAAEERKAHALIDAGYDGSFNGEAYRSVFYQNSNNSVRVSDEFMKAVEARGSWATHYVTTGEVHQTYQAYDIFRSIAVAAYECGDPGLQYDTTINRWHTCLTTSRIFASNPCSEYMFLDDSACNLASLNLRKFQRRDEFDVVSFTYAVELTILAQESIVDNSRYPTAKITRNSKAYRPLGLGYANLGAFLMAWGLPYDSSDGRLIAAAITAIMTGRAYAMSARLAELVGPFDGYANNRTDFMRVMRQHQMAANNLNRGAGEANRLSKVAQREWEIAVDLGELHGYRNAQTTVLAPTGTIGFMMDVDTTGIEPDIALVKYKRLVGGGTLKLVNQTVREALQRLAYDDHNIEAALEHIARYDTIEDVILNGELIESPITEQDQKVFDCAFSPANGKRSISVEGHILMMAACQPFLSGAISKTVNLPNDCTVEDIENAYMMAWRLGLKAVAVYRNGCKRSQPVSTSKTEQQKQTLQEAVKTERRWGDRKRLPQHRYGQTVKLNLAGHEGLLTVNHHPDGSFGEIIVRMHKEGSTVGALLDAWAIAVSMGLQAGIEPEVVITKFQHTRFEPSGFTSEDQDVSSASSLIDYICQHLAKMLKGPTLRDTAITLNESGALRDEIPTKIQIPAGVYPKVEASTIVSTYANGPPCAECGHLTVRQGPCVKCLNCGSPGGCG
jgi:ribonucleoside-diphosphate reductase alpha chain